MTDLGAWIALVQNGGLALAVVALILGGVRGWYHWDSEYQDLRQDRDDWKALALKGTNLAERALDVPPPRKR